MRWAKRRCAGHHRRSGWHHHGPRLLLQCEHNRTHLHGSEVNHRLFSATISYFSFAFFFFYNFVMSSSVVSVEDHQQTFRSHPMRVLRLHQILSVSELMDGRSCRRAGPISTGGLDTRSSSAVFLSLSWLLRPLPSRRTVSWDSALVPALAGRGGEAAWTAAQLPCRSRSPQQMHLDEPSHMDVVVPLWLKRCQVSIKTRCVRLNIGFFFSFFVTRWTSFILFILFFRKVPTVFHIWMILRRWIKNTRGGCRCQEAAFIFKKKNPWLAPVSSQCGAPRPTDPQSSAKFPTPLGF